MTSHTRAVEPLRATKLAVCVRLRITKGQVAKRDGLILTRSAGMNKQSQLRADCYTTKFEFYASWCNVTAMNRRRSLPSDPEFLLQFMEDVDNDCSDDDFDGCVDEVTEALPGEVNDGGAAKEMLHIS